MAQRSKPQLLIRENYLNVARATVGSKMFRTLFYKIGDKKIDVLRNGDLSCAFFVSAILKLFNVIDHVHTTVVATEKNLMVRGWKPIKRPLPGAVIVWGAKTFKSGETHKHIGFYLGAAKAVSNSSKKRSPKIHAWDYRSIEKILYKKNLP